MKRGHAESTFEPIPESTFNRLVRTVGNMNNRITEIAPTVITKTAYIGDTTCTFDKVKDGMILATVNGVSANHEVINNQIIVSFDELEDVAEVKISIQ